MEAGLTGVLRTSLWVLLSWESLVIPLPLKWQVRKSPSLNIFGHAGKRALVDCIVSVVSHVIGVQMPCATRELSSGLTFSAGKHWYSLSTIVSSGFSRSNKPYAVLNVCGL